MHSGNSQAFLSLVRLGIGHQARPCEAYDWASIKSLADNQGLSAIVLDAIEKLPNDKRPPQGFLLNWIGEVLQAYEQRYTQYTRVISEMASFYNNHGYKMMVLKGYACSLNWSKPEHRPCGDIDIWQFGDQKEADGALKEKGIAVDTSHHHHTVFIWKGFSVENHYDFINVHHHKSNVELENILKELGQDDSHCIDVLGNKVYLPSPNLHALFLVRHTLSDFAATNVTIRQLLDWAFFVQKYTDVIDWKWLKGTIDQFGMTSLYNAFNAICVEDLGFESSIFNYIQFDPLLKERVLKEIIAPTFPIEKPKHFFTRIVWKWRRWRANEWKHQLVYKESMWSAFWSGVWNHLLKPASI